MCPALCSRGVSGANEQQREKRGRRGWWLVGLLAVSGAVVGAFAGHRLDPDVKELAPSLAVAGFGLGGLVGLFLLAPVGGGRAWRRGGLVAGWPRLRARTCPTARRCGIRPTRRARLP